MRSLFAILILSVTAVGCRIPGLYSPAPAALVSCRQLSQQGIGALERGQQKDAETLLAKAVSTCPTDADAHRYYAETLWLRGARPEAVAQLEQACRLTSDNAAIQVRLAEMHLTMGRVEPARQSVELAIAQNPKLPSAWAIRGRIMHAEGNLPQALADYHRALGFLPDDRQVLSEIADVYRQLHQPQRSLETLQSLAETYAVGEEPQQVLFMLGLAYVALERYDDGITSLATAAARDRPTPEILYRLGEAQWLAGRPGDATVSLQQALALAPQDQPSRQLLTQIEVAQQNPALRR
jgi:tetratricopeptide (TPR) repeat protein